MAYCSRSENRNPLLRGVAAGRGVFSRFARSFEFGVPGYEFRCLGLANPKLETRNFEQIYVADAAAGRFPT